jgi:tryptophan synthase beta chain
MKDLKVLLPVEDLPTHWYNILPDLPKPLPPPLDPRTLRPPKPELLMRIFAKECILQEVSQERRIPIPEEVKEAYLRIGRPTPLHRALRLEKKLGTPARIFFKREDLSPAGSHKPNTAIAQAYYAAKDGVERLTTETGAGQWGTALSLACAMFGLQCTVYMTRSSYQQKPYRRTVMELYGSKVYPSPSDQTNVGRSFLAKDPNHPGSLGLAISEAVEDCLSDQRAKYSLGSVLNHVLLHQTVVGQEAKKQMEALGEYPDVITGCIGGGSNYAGLCYPFMEDKLKGKASSDFVAVEPTAVPSTTKGVYAYDYGDTGKLTFLAKMFTVGYIFQCPPIHAGGLRYHGKAPSMSLLINEGYMRSVAYSQNEALETGRLFAQTEGIVPAPETNYAIKAAVDVAIECKRTGKQKTILLNFSGHGLLDLKAYEDFMSGRLPDFAASPKMIEESLANLPAVQQML